MDRSFIFFDRFEELVNEFKSNSDSVGIVHVGSAEQKYNHNVEQSLICQQFNAALTESIAVLCYFFEFHRSEESVEKLVVTWQTVPFDVFVIDANILNLLY